jgi:hypothetical protein
MPWFFAPISPNTILSAEDGFVVAAKGDEAAAGTNPARPVAAKSLVESAKNLRLLFDMFVYNYFA